MLISMTCFASVVTSLLGTRKEKEKVFHGVDEFLAFLASGAFCFLRIVHEEEERVMTLNGRPLSLRLEGFEKVAMP